MQQSGGINIYGGKFTFKLKELDSSEHREVHGEHTTYMLSCEWSNGGPKLEWQVPHTWKEYHTSLHQTLKVESIKVLYLEQAKQKSVKLPSFNSFWQRQTSNVKDQRHQQLSQYLQQLRNFFEAISDGYDEGHAVFSQPPIQRFFFPSQVRTIARHKRQGEIQGEQEPIGQIEDEISVAENMLSSLERQLKNAQVIQYSVHDTAADALAETG